MVEGCCGWFVIVFAGAAIVVDDDYDGDGDDCG